MNNAKHTPGEWKWDEPSNWHGTAARVYHPNDEKYEPIAQVQISGWPRRTALANASLIASSPDLLAALEAAYKVMTVDGENDLEEWNATLTQIEAALDKAKGQ